jgi:hypothetical protein
MWPENLKNGHRFSYPYLPSAKSSGHLIQTIEYRRYSFLAHFQKEKAGRKNAAILFNLYLSIDTA